MTETCLQQQKAILSLILLVPAPTIAVLSAMVFFPDTSLGKTIFIFCKVWLFLLPVVWFKLVDKQSLSLSPIKKGGLGLGLLSGILISAIILIAYGLLRHSLIDPDLVIEKVTSIGLASKMSYLGGSLYWILVNSVLEEYVWRWFVVKQSEILFKPRGAVIFSAALFTIHHIFALQTYFGWGAVLLCAAGIFIGGLILSFFYVRYRSIWPGYLCHAVIDLAVFGIGAFILFG